MTDLRTLVHARHSVRAFRPDAVPEETIRRVFEVAQHSPSNCNVQPWRVWVASGAARDRLGSSLVSAIERGDDPATEDPIDDFKGEYRDLQIACAVEMYGHMGVPRGDKVARTKAFMRNYELFDAPHVAIIGIENTFGTGVVLDVGIWLGTLMLAFTEAGIGTCPMASLRSHPKVVRGALGIPDSIRILCGLTFGYEDRDAPVNRTRQKRESIDQNVRFLID